jgi:hypothetical protein
MLLVLPQHVAAQSPKPFHGFSQNWHKSNALDFRKNRQSLTAFGFSSKLT